MKIVFLLLLASLLFGEHIYEKIASQANKDAMQNSKIKCRWICDKKIYKEQKIADAVSFYRESKHYKFTNEGFSSF